MRFASILHRMPGFHSADRRYERFSRDFPDPGPSRPPEACPDARKVVPSCHFDANGLDQAGRRGGRERDMTMLRDDINNAVKDAMRAKDERKLSTLRMVNSTIKNADIAARGEGKPPLSDADLLGVLQKMIKQRQESVELYDKGGRAELATQEREEIAIISAYLPKQMSEDDVKAAISAIIAETNAAGVKDMGKVIGALKAKYAGQMDFGKASGMVKSALSS
jgi:uncharacterized protein